MEPKGPLKRASAILDSFKRGTEKNQLQSHNTIIAYAHVQQIPISSLDHARSQAGSGNLFLHIVSGILKY